MGIHPRRTVLSAGITICTSHHVSALTMESCGVMLTMRRISRCGEAPHRGVQGETPGRHRMGLRTVLLPKDNEKDWRKIPQEILSSLTMHFVGPWMKCCRLRWSGPRCRSACRGAPVAEPFVAGAEKDKSLTN